MRLIFPNFLLVCVLVTILSCKKDDDVISPDTLLAESELQMEMAFDDVDYITYEAIELSRNLHQARLMHDEGPLGVACVKISYSLRENTTTVDFGEGCKGPDGKTRKGKLIISYNDKYFAPLSETTTILEKYAVNNIVLEGTRKVINLSTEPTLTPVFSLQIENGKITWPNGTTATRETNQTRTWDIPEDKNTDIRNYVVEGVASGTARDGSFYTSYIKTPLAYYSDCEEAHSYLPVSGTVTLTLKENSYSIGIDYGSGTCDNRATVEINGQTKQIELK